MHKKIKILLSSGDEDFWDNVVVTRSDGYLIVHDESGLQAEYAPGMWMKWEVES